MKICLQRLLLPALCALILLLGGCGNKQDPYNQASVGVTEAILVELTVIPGEVKVGESIRFEAKVTYQDQPVDDAKEVMFELVRTDGSTDESVMETVSSSGEGLYVWETSLDEAGEYEVTSHVTALDQHSMPSETFIVNE
ncbi:FixH family protein [Paenibacillus antibioticophila]|uniref:FixH family protein n=1 Tax=Paenibacillus antibioticophila TaxID=1274374 RepID=UPI0005CABDD7|nr:FixH family protein [Paenibacillus antibioticophila]